MTKAKTYALLTLLAPLLAGCPSAPMAPATAPTPVAAPAAMAPAAPAPAPVAAQPQPGAASTVATVTLPEYLDPKSSISTARSVYFDFDNYAVKTEFNGLIEQHGKYLATHAALAVKVEGNCDERGSAEYNLALGQKRAQAVVRALKIYGARDAQMEAISWGEEKPKAPGHDESAWAQNRRADLRYPAR